MEQKDLTSTSNVKIHREIPALRELFNNLRKAESIYDVIKDAAENYSKAGMYLPASEIDRLSILYQDILGAKDKLYAKIALAGMGYNYIYLVDLFLEAVPKVLKKEYKDDVEIVDLTPDVPEDHPKTFIVFFSAFKDVKSFKEAINQQSSQEIL